MARPRLRRRARRRAPLAAPGRAPRRWGKGSPALPPLPSPCPLSAGGRRPPPRWQRRDEQRALGTRGRLLPASRRRPRRDPAAFPDAPPGDGAGVAADGSAGRLAPRLVARSGRRARRRRGEGARARAAGRSAQSLRLRGSRRRLAARAAGSAASPHASGGQPLASLAPTRLDDPPASRRRHADAKAVRLVAVSLLRLIRPLDGRRSVTPLARGGWSLQCSGGSAARAGAPRGRQMEIAASISAAPSPASLARRGLEVRAPRRPDSGVVGGPARC